jgi:hypothetical protein
MKILLENTQATFLFEFFRKSLGIFDDFFLFIERFCMKAISKIIDLEFMQII